MYKIVPAERQGHPKEMIIKTAVNHRKTAYSGHFGTPGETRTHYIPLRRRTLYPGEVRGHIQKIFNFTGLRDSNGSIVRRRTLYPAELPGQVRFSVLRRRYRIIVPQFAASVNAGGGFCPEFRLIFWQKKLHRSFFYGIISGRAYERRSHPVPASPRIFDRTAALPHGSDGALQDSPCQF